MKFKNWKTVNAFLIILLMMSCSSKPKVIKAETSTSGGSDASSIPAFKDVPGLQNSASAEHKVKVEEVMNTAKYTYLHVSENDEKRWIAIPKREVQLGDVYYYKGGLMKQDFYSQEFDRTFETVYLVSNIWKEQSNGAGGGSALDEALRKTKGREAVDLTIGNISPAEGSVSIAELMANKEKYNGKLVKITGKCIKVNPMIMQRNWLHIKDSSTDEFDLTVTTMEKIPLGAVLSLEGTIALDKDFGSGYRYDIIMEGAVLK